ncbi:hypothetical protein [Streptomyces sp. MP131-18]|uniref:hypothetical protein n=1 Tax=Streptomyces sp. MP131-18 TaxID=1857892 RepID=UPI00097C116A|nr:hypothetical protein [Streptomyces sp. MP131-18]ONK13197.1 hypothetical protein STBA_39600 [Streptomyces sp. MP131-18]
MDRRVVLRRLLGGMAGTALAMPPRTAHPPAGRLHDVERAVTRAQRAFSDGRYRDLAASLPALITAAETAAAHPSPGAHAQALLSRSYVLLCELAVKTAALGDATAAGERALAAARASGLAVPVAAAARARAVTLRKTGHADAAVTLLIDTATDLDTRRAGPWLTATRSGMLLTAAYTAAQAGSRGTALELAGQAEELAARAAAAPGAGGLITAGPAQCALYRIGIHTVLGEPGEAVHAVQGLRLGDFATPERRARYHTDTARMWHGLGEHHRAFAALLQIEAHSPEDARRPAVRALTARLVGSAARPAEERAFAARTGAAGA